MTELITTEIIGLLGTAIAALLSLCGVIYRVRFQRNEAEGEVDELETELANAPILMRMDEFIPGWERIVEDVDNLIATSNVDRVLFFKALNGKMEPKRTTCFWGKGTHQRYDWFPIESSYLMMMHRMKDGHSISFITDDLHESEQIKGVYEDDEVTSAAWFHIGHIRGRTPGAWIWLYMSIATRDGHIITPAEIRRGRMIVNEVQKLTLGL